MIDATTGEITFTQGCYYCFEVSATNGCGTTSQILTICD
jgi:hypothetical protein